MSAFLGLTMSDALLVVGILPLVVAVASWWLPPAAAKAASLAAAVVSLVGAAWLVGERRPVTAAAGWLRADALSVVFLLTVAFLYVVTVVFAIGYIDGHGGGQGAGQGGEQDRGQGGRPSAGQGAASLAGPGRARIGSSGGSGARYQRHLFAGLDLFCWAMLVAPLASSLALVWVAIEVTTVVSALLVAIDDTDGASEAAWKYILLASLGLGIALLAVVVLYAAGASVLGQGYELFTAPLLTVASRLPKPLVTTAFLLAVVGFGTKMGLFPVHTWLPDAHSEAPTPVSALLSGALLAVSFYAILRFYEVAVRCLGAALPRETLLAFGLASLAFAALSVARQRDLKRLLAYSSIEHMGILAVGMSFSATLAIVGVLLHVLAHAAAKGTAFFGAGNALRSLHTKDLRVIRGGLSLLPWGGPMLVLAVLALSALPPFGIFRSELLIVAGGLQSGHDAVALVLVGLTLLATLGLTWYTSAIMLSPPAATPASDPAGSTTSTLLETAAPAGRSAGAGPEAVTGRLAGAGPEPPPSRRNANGWIATSMVVGLVALTVLGLHPPGSLMTLLTHAAIQLGGVR